MCGLFAAKPKMLCEVDGKMAGAAQCYPQEGLRDNGPVSNPGRGQTVASEWSSTHPRNGMMKRKHLHTSHIMFKD